MRPKSRRVREFSTSRPDEALVVTSTASKALDRPATLARNPKVDIAKMSYLTLAGSMLEFIRNRQEMNLELAADYLVMAAWLPI